MKQRIHNEIKGDWAGKNLIYYDETDSTNVRAKQLSMDGAPHGTLVVADKQTAGRGRRGRTWDSPSEEAIYMTLLLKPNIKSESASMLTIVAAMAIAKAMQNILGQEVYCGIKWPNDILIDGKKVCGILTEMTALGAEIQSVVVGIGINVNNVTFPEELRDIATSLKLEAGREFDKARIIGQIMLQFERYYDAFVATEDLSQMTEDYNQLLVHANRKIYVLEQNGARQVIAKGLAPNGALMIMEEDGNENAVISGEVSIREHLPED